MAWTLNITPHASLPTAQMHAFLFGYVITITTCTFDDVGIEYINMGNHRKDISMKTKGLETWGKVNHWNQLLGDYYKDLKTVKI